MFIHIHVTTHSSRKIALSVLRTFVTSQHEKIVNISLSEQSFLSEIFLIDSGHQIPTLSLCHVRIFSTRLFKIAEGMKIKGVIRHYLFYVFISSLYCSMKLHILYEGKGEVIPVHTMKADTGIDGTAPHTFLTLALDGGDLLLALCARAVLRI